MPKRFAVLGLGRFGTKLARALSQRGGDVIAADGKIEPVEEIKNDVAVAVQLDSTDEDALRAQGIDQVDVAVVCMGGNFEASVLSTMLIKSMGVPLVMARATKGVQTKILEAVGADRVVHPEEEVALKLAETLTVESILDYLQVSPNVHVAQIQAPKRFWGRTLEEIQLARNYGIHVVAIRRGEHDVDEVPDAKTEILEGDVLIVVGRPQNIQKTATLDETV
jgi:trk system potassium uptake protein TrkA